jgi:hypothetical protein
VYVNGKMVLLKLFQEWGERGWRERGLKANDGGG